MEVYNLDIFMAIIIGVLLLFWSVYLIKTKCFSAFIYAIFLVSPIVYVFVAQLPSKRWFILTLLFFYLQNELLRKQGGKLRTQYLKFPLKVPLAIMFIGSVLLLIFDERFSLFTRIFYIFQDALNIYLVLFLVFSFLNHSNNSLDSICKPIILCCLAVELYGIFNYVTHTNPIIEFFNTIYSLGDTRLESFATGDTHADGSRSGVLSIYRYTFDYGYNSILFLLMLLYFYFKQHKDKFLLISCMLLAFIGLALSGSRTVIISGMISAIIFVIFSKKSRKKYQTIVGCIVIGLAAFLTIPAVNNMVMITIESIFTRTAEVSGSSIDMREAQLQGSLLLWSQNPVLGNGYKYIFLDLGWKDGTMVDDMAGYESIVYILLIERGIIGIVVYLIFFISLYGYYLKNMKVDRQLCVLGMSLLTAFLLFAVGTGVLDAWLNTMVMQGLLIYYIEKQKSVLRTLRQNYCE